MTTPRIHLVAPAGSARPFLLALGSETPAEFVHLVQETVGPRYRVTADETVLMASEDDAHGGRTDDRERAADLESALADSEVVAIVAVRGGAWMTRILPRIDFAVLRHRSRSVAVFGFSEQTTLVNIVGGQPNGIGVYDLGPAFLTYGLKRFAVMNPHSPGVAGRTPHDWMRAQRQTETRSFFRDIVDILEGRGSSRTISATLLQGEIPPGCTPRFVGGNLTVLSTMIGSVYESSLQVPGAWLVLEDYNDKIERIDRFLAHLTLAGWWGRYDGLLLGDFHQGDADQVAAVLELLKFHLPADRMVPILSTRQLGHVWPMAPLVLHVPSVLTPNTDGTLTIEFPKTILEQVTR